jgi:hypothetical protein
MLCSLPCRVKIKQGRVWLRIKLAVKNREG